MKSDRFAICRCGHAEVDHERKKTSSYDAPEIFSNPFTRDGFSGETRKECKFCSCKRFNPSAKHKTKWFGIGVTIVVVLAVIYRMFVAK